MYSGDSSGARKKYFESSRYALSPVEQRPFSGDDDALARDGLIAWIGCDGLHLLDRGGVALGERYFHAAVEAHALIVPSVDHLADADVGMEQIRSLEGRTHTNDRAPAVSHQDQLVLAAATALEWFVSRSRENRRLIGDSRGLPPTVEFRRFVGRSASLIRRKARGRFIVREAAACCFHQSMSLAASMARYPARLDTDDVFR